MIEELKALELFEGLTDEALELLGEIIDLRVYQPDEEIFCENGKGDKLYVIKSGKVRVIKSVDSSESQTMAILSQGDFFGEISFLDKQPHSATVKAMKETAILSISRNDFDELAESNPQQGYTILHRIATEVGNLLRQMDEKFVDMVKFVWEFGAKS